MHFSWYADLILRIKELESWTSDFSLPPSVWLSGFFNPQSFLTAIMQVQKMISHAFFSYTHFLIWSQIISFYQNVVLQSQSFLTAIMQVRKMISHAFFYLYNDVIRFSCTLHLVTNYFFLLKCCSSIPNRSWLQSCRYEKMKTHCFT